MQLDQRSRTKPHALGILRRKSISQNHVQQELRLKIRAGRSEFNLANAISKIESLAVLGWRSKQSLQSPAEIRGFADVGLTFSDQQENRRSGGEFLKKALVLVRREVEAAREHVVIVVVATCALGDRSP